ncbi:histidine kinase [Amycolatopsis nigrescens]|uniref:histidine kinase n=1 Tax=Amycolatopsis nigrescens TaxID=381445 RepID=UPI0003807D36|nr:histidine kinase [Amycolatopsis nigrescens]
MVFASSAPGWPVRERVLDGAVLVVLGCLTCVLPLFLPDGEAALNPLAGTAGFVLVAAGLRAAWRRRIDVQLAPVAVVAAGLATWALLAPGQTVTADEPTNLLMPLAPAFPLYAGYVYLRDRRRAWAIAVLLAIVAVHPWSTSVTAGAAGLLYVCAPMLFGFYLVARQELVSALTDRAERAELERDLLIERARAAERTRLAAELHDVVTHRVSLMVLHAGALRVTATGRRTRDAAEDVRATGCDALAELRDLIGVLRDAPAREREVPPRERPAPAGRPGIGGTDVGIAAACVAWTFLGTIVVLSFRPGGFALTVPWPQILVQLPAAVAMVARRRYPASAAVMTLLAALALLLLPPPWPSAGGAHLALLPAVVPVAAFAVGAHARRPVAGAVPLLGLFVLIARPWTPQLPVITVAAVFVGVPALLGLYTAARRRLIAALVDRAERAERERSLRAERAMAEERAGIAGEMRDIVAGRVRHMLDRAALLVEDASPEARDAATELVATGEQALTELHDLVGALRAPAGSTEAATDLAGLAAESASVGIPVELVEDGDPAALSPTIARTTHRVVREALTNVRKHAHGAAVRVRVRYAADGVRVEVRNARPPDVPPGGDPGLAAGGSGTGLTGLRHRVELIDGTLRAEPTPEGGFAVDAILPAYVPTGVQARDPTENHDY